MKKSKLIIRILLISLIIISCNKDENIGGVLVKFYNETGFILNNLNIADTDIGKMEIKSSTDYILFDKFGFDTGVPDENCNGIILNQSIKSFNEFYWCGTEKNYVDKGTYEMTIKLIEIDTAKYLRIALK